MTDLADAPAFCNQAEFGRLNGWGKSYVTKLKIEGRLVFNAAGEVDVQASLARIQSTTERPEQASPPAVDGTMQTLQAQEKRLDIQRKQREELHALGELLERDQVLGSLADAVVTFRSAFEAWPERLSPPIAALGGDEARIRAFLADQVEHVFIELSQRFSAMATRAA
jgi:hypothetical protein